MIPHSQPINTINPHVIHHYEDSIGDIALQHQGYLSLSQQINASTREGHDVVNRLIMSRLSLGLQDHTLYREGILSFAFIYKTFEEEWASIICSDSHSVDPRVKIALQNLYSTPLLRTPQLTKDLRYYFGSTPFSIETPNTLQRIAYVTHIRQAVAEKPHVLIAYAYNYYMALFAGGKILKYQIAKAKDFFPERYKMTKQERIIAGTNLFSFETEPRKEDELRTAFKEVLSDFELTLTTEERNDIVEESKIIFSNNVLLIKELDQICAYLATTPPGISVEMTSKISDKYKLLVFFAFFMVLLIAKRVFNYP